MRYRPLVSRSLYKVLLTAALILINQFCWASPKETKLSGFLNASVSTSNNETPLFFARDISDDINFIADTSLGIQLDSEIDAQTRVSAQLIARDESDHFDTNAEWLYLARKISSNWEIRTGRLRTPVHMLSDTVYVGVTYPWVRPPDEVYNIFANITRYTGLDLTYDIELGFSSNYLRLFVGEIKDNIPLFGSVAQIESEEFYGLELQSTSVNNVFRMAVLRVDAQIESSMLPNLDSSGTDIVSIGDRFSWGNNEFITEYSIRITQDEDKDTKSWGWYGTASHTRNNCTFYGTLAIRDSAHSTLLTRDAQSFALGSLYHLNTNFAIKTEVQHTEATQESRGMFQAAPDDEDAVLVTIAINAVF